MTIASTVPVVLSEMLASLWIAVPVLLLFALAEGLHRYQGVETELTRKLSHLGSGLVVSCLPWVVSSHWTVLGLAGGFAVVLAGSRAVGLLPSVHAVARQTSGAIYYPVAVYLIYLLANGDVFLFQVPILIMALSDTGAAVVGKRYGIIQYRVIEDYRSLGGSTTFFGVTFALVLVGHGLAGFTDLPSVLIVTLLVSLLTTAVEAVSVRGADNVLVPYIAFLVLESTRELPADALGGWALYTALVLAVLLFTHRATRLNTTGFLAAFVLGTLTASLAGPIWLSTIAIPYMGLAIVGFRERLTEETDLSVIAPTLAVPAAILLTFIHTAEHRLFVPFIASAATISSIAAARFAATRFESRYCQPLAVWPAIMVVVLPSVLQSEWPSMSATAVASVVIAALVGPIVFRLLERRKHSFESAQICGVVTGTSGGLFWLSLEVLM